jgi:hypothetical protein
LRRSQLFGAANFERTLRARRDSKGRVHRRESRAPVGRMSPGRARITPADRSLPERRSPTYCFGNTDSTSGRRNGGRVVGGRGFGVRKRGGSRVTHVFVSRMAECFVRHISSRLGWAAMLTCRVPVPLKPRPSPSPPTPLAGASCFSFDRLSFNRSPVDRPRRRAGGSQAALISVSA